MIGPCVALCRRCVDGMGCERRRERKDVVVAVEEETNMIWLGRRVGDYDGGGGGGGSGKNAIRLF
jgi:hypothetical protein